MINDILEILSWLAAVVMILNYWMVSTGRSKVDSIRYHLVVALTSLTFALYSANLHAWPNCAINSIFVLVSLKLLIKVWMQR